jgi:hypothetical protein
MWLRAAATRPIPPPLHEQRLKQPVGGACQHSLYRCSTMSTMADKSKSSIALCEVIDCRNGSSARLVIATTARTSNLTAAADHPASTRCQSSS